MVFDAWASPVMDRGARDVQVASARGCLRHFRSLMADSETRYKSRFITNHSYLLRSSRAKLGMRSRMAGSDENEDVREVKSQLRTPQRGRSSDARTRVTVREVVETSVTPIIVPHRHPPKRRLVSLVSDDDDDEAPPPASPAKRGRVGSAPQTAPAAVHGDCVICTEPLVTDAPLAASGNRSEIASQAGTNATVHPEEMHLLGQLVCAPDEEASTSTTSTAATHARHTFHLPCIMLWAGTATTCPIDRCPFTEVLVLTEGSATEVKRRIAVKQKFQPNHQLENPYFYYEDGDAPPEDWTFCEVCRERHREDVMLLCEGCDLGFHTFCVGLGETVPETQWMCDACTARQLQRNLADESAEGSDFVVPVLGRRCDHR